MNRSLKELSPEQIGFLARRLRASRVSSAPDRIPRRPEDAGDALLSDAQQRLWFLEQLEPANPAYNITSVFDLTGDLDAAALALGLREVVRRHEVLRTTFATVAARPVQRVSAAAVFELPRVDLDALPADVRRRIAEELAVAEARRGFDLGRLPLLRAVLLRLERRRYRLVLVMHHIVSDGWSSGVLARELGMLYRTFAARRPPTLPPLPLQYVDYAAWQRSRGASGALDGVLAAAQRDLEGAAPLEIPTDRPRSPAKSFRGGRAPLRLEPATVAAARALAEANQTSLFAVLLATMAVLLERVTQQQDLVIGAPWANRTRVEVEGLVGLFVNSLPVRLDLAGDPRFDELVRRARAVTVTAHDRQELPFERLVEALQPERSLAQNPLFQVMLSLQSTPVRLELPGLGLRLLDVDNGTSKLDLLLAFAEEEGALQGYFEYSADLFDAPFPTRLARHFSELLRDALNDPEHRLSELRCLDPAARHQMMVEWNDTAPPPEADACVHDLVAAQVDRTPDAVAVVDGGARITYRELWRAAIGLARGLRGLGVGPEVRVGVCLDRRADLIVSLLAVLEAGGAYVPLDPAYPAARLAFTLKDSQAALVITQRRWEELLAGGARRLLLDGESGAAATVAAAGSPHRVEPGNLAYVIYTSGSTGRPKGVAIEHRSAAAFLHWSRRAFGNDELAVVLAATSVCFDLSVFEIFAPLCRGGTVVLAENALALPALEAASTVTLLDTVPSAAAELVSTGGIPPSVTTVCLAGEPLPGKLVRQLYALGTVRRVLNLYGPSEDTTYSTAAVVPPEVETPSIGRPLAATRTYLVDRHLRPVPPGALGELLLGSATLARGYLDRPGATAARFVPDALGADFGARLYRTGDIARHIPDGSLAFLGRIDHQVKVRGFRIEPGEVEAALLVHPGVRQAVVAARPGPGGLRLVAWVSTAEGREVAADELRGTVRRQLPEYMTPAAVVVLPALPLLPNGKVDRAALPAPEGAADALGHEALRGVTEELVAAVWTDLLAVERVGRTDDFFALGGHSLLATRAVARLRDMFAVELAVRDLFETPRLADLAALLARKAGGVAAAPIPPVRRDGPLPLSFAQERLWFLHHLDPDDAAYHMPLAFRLRGPIDARLVEAGLGCVAARHEVLRTSYPTAGGEARQEVAAALRIAVPRIDLSALPAADRERLARRLAHFFGALPFDLGRGPVLRAALLELDDDERVLCLVLHHIAADGWSLALLSDELSAACAALAARRRPELPALPIQAADHAAWERARLTSEELERELAHWRRRLGDRLEPLELPLDRPRSSRRSDPGGQLAVTISSDLHQRLTALGRAEGSTLFMVLLAVLQVLLARLTGQRVITVGAPVARRERMELERLIGCFVNLLPLRATPGRSSSFCALLAEIREATLDATAHQEVPFERLVAAFSPERRLDHDPIFQVLFVLQNGPARQLELPGVMVERLDLEPVGSRLDLTLAVEELEGGGLRASWEYRRHLFDPSTVRRFAGAFVRLAAAAVAAADTAPSSLPLLAPAERQQLLHEWNDTGSARGDDGACLHEAVSHQAARTPDAPALECEGEVLTYAELERRTDRVAARLERLGLGPGARIGLYVERSLAAVVGLIGVLKAGAAYVPLEPALPAARLAYLLEDAEIAAVLTLERLRPRLPAAGAGLPVLVCDVPETSPPAAPRGPRPTPEQPAYVLYTSGSTGRPKGVTNAHRGVVARLAWVQDLLRLDAADRQLHKTPLGFDVSVGEIFGPLSAGACLVIARPDGHEDPDYLVRTVIGRRITVLHFVPSMLQAFLEAPGVAGCSSLRRVLASGEALPPELAHRASSRLGVPVTNLYGPTEAAIEVSAWTWWPGTERRDVPMGRPAPGNRLHVVDPAGRLAPLGIPGELAIAGAQVARGYWRRPKLTAERFVPDPYGAEPGARMYRTGDLVRHLPGGELVFLRRIDQQVKIRGLRIELGEIESVLLAQPGVRHAAVLVRDGVAGARLVAYVALAEEAATAVPRLRARLAEVLPGYMVPAAFVPMAALPLTASGKVDRKALPEPASPTDDGAIADPPRGPAEELMAEIFADLLGRRPVGRRDDFFSAGGHSLLAARLVSRIRDLFRAELPLRAVFEATTVADLGARLAGADRAVDEPILLRPRGTDPPLSVGQERIWFLEQVDGSGGAYHIPCAVCLDGRLDVSALRRALTGLVARHEVLRTVYRRQGGDLIQLVELPVQVPLPLIDLRALSPVIYSRAGNAVIDAMRRRLDLERGPVLCAALLRTADEEHRLLLDVHHIAADGASLEIMLREVVALYALEPLPAPALQYADFAVWQRRRLAAEETAREVAWWRQRLDGAPPALDLPTDRPRSAERSFGSGRIALQLEPELAERLRALGRRLGATPFMTLLAAFQILLARWSGQRDFVLGTPVASRSRSELEPLVGMFLNVLALRADLSGDPSFVEVVGRVRETALDAFAHQEVPFERLLEELRPEREPGRAPIFQVFFNVLGFSRAPVTSSGLTIVPEAPPEVPAKLDLTLYVSDPQGEIRLDLVYNAALFDRARAEELLAQYALLLARVVDAPERPVAGHELVTAPAAVVLPDPTATLGETWEAMVHERFAECARRWPERPALCGPRGEWTYGQLLAASARLAHELRRHGLGTGEVVAVWASREPALVVALLGVLAAGGAFCLLDPLYPSRRLAACLRTARPRIWLRVAAVAEPPEVTQVLADLGVAARLEVSSQPPEDTDRSELAELPGVDAGARDLAYVIFTSGTTGEPKGILGEHGPLGHFLTWYAATFALAADDRFALLSGLSHDPLLRDVFAPLWVGAQLHLPEAPDQPLASDLAGWLRRERVTVAHLTPPLARILSSELPDLRLLAFGGDVLSWSEVERLRRLAPAARCVSFYGATETPQAMAWFEAEGRGDGRVPLGVGIDQVQLLVLAPTDRLAGIGEIGEIVVRTPHLARGYLDDAELTRARFVANPFAAASPRDRLYRTGDLGRFRSDGAVEFVGRADRQVKIRGLRLELAEIESVLERHPAVHQAAVVARERAPGDLALVAYVVTEPGRKTADLRPYLVERLPAWAVPSAVMALPELPLTQNGKLAVGELPEPPSASVPEDLRSVAEERLAAVWCEVLGLPAVGRHGNFFELGGHSLHLVEVHRRLRNLGFDQVTLVDLFRHPTIATLARFLEPAAEPAASVQPAGHRRAGGNAVAIVGMSGRFPRAPDLATFWRNLEAGSPGITFFSEDELRQVEADAVLADPAYVRAKGVLEDAEKFDREFFGYSARESEILDPQQRVFLECAWEALEEAGHMAASFAGRIGVFGGTSLNTYLLNAGADPSRLADLGGYQALLAGDKDHLATRVAYKLALTGPAVTVQTTCSTSLVAVHLACRSLLDGECDMTLAGGVSITFPMKIGYLWEEGGIGSPDGRCRPFDARAAGTVGGNGAGIVVLRRLADAVADGDRILAVIRGSAINNDGARKVGYTAPSPDGQAQVIAAALAAADVAPETVSYIEAHGTGTSLGDPIEIAALRQAFAGVPEGARCAVGAVKSNIGHLSAAAGVAGLIKTLLALHHRRIPPNPGFETPSSKIDFAGSPFFVNRDALDWPAGESPRRAGVSSFGFGGTNAHLILEEAPSAQISPKGRDWQLLVLSGLGPGVLDAYTERLADHLENASRFADLAYTLQVGRQAFPHRLALVARDSADAVAALRQPGRPRVARARAFDGERPVVFLFPGQGAQRVGMGQGLYRSEPLVRELVDRCAERLAPALGLDLRKILWPPAGHGGAAARLTETALAQPALFVLEVALARLWMSWGVRPRALLGHSLGEIVAACVAGVFSLEDALDLVAARGAYMQAQPPGAMLAVPLSEAALRRRLDPDLALAAVNGPELCVVSGPAAAVDALERRLAAADLSCTRLHTSHAFHSPSMARAAEAIRELLEGSALQAPEIPFLSNLTGTWIRPEEATAPAYWAQLMLRTVRFSAGLNELSRNPAVLLEVGPGRSLARLAARHPARTAVQAMVSSLPAVGEEDEDRQILEAAGRLWLEGVTVSWPDLHRGHGRRRVAAPTYPFARQRYTLLDGGRRAAPPAGVAAMPRADLADWLHVPTWRPDPLPAGGDGVAYPCLVLAPGNALGDRLIARLRRDGSVVEVRPGERFEKSGAASYVLDPRESSDYLQLFDELRAGDLAPRTIVHLWTLDRKVERSLSRSLDELLAAPFFSLLHLGRALAESEGGPCRMLVVSSGAQAVAAETVRQPEAATLLGPCRVLPLEIPGLEARAIDLEASDGTGDTLWVELLAAELAAGSAGMRLAVVAYRGGRRWVQGWAPARLDPVAGPAVMPRPSGVVLITGGFGGIGLRLAEHLARTARARLALVGRVALPERSAWEGWLEAHGPDDVCSRRILAVRELEAVGAEVLPLAADVSDLGQMRRALASVRERFGNLHGVVHAAGVPGGGLVFRRTAAAAAAVLMPKVRGTLVLDELLGAEPLDFFVLCSSRVAVLARPGQVDYCAANAFLDAWALAATGRSVVSIGWEGWKETGMAVGVGSQHGLAAADGVEIFARVLGRGLPHVVVSRRPLAALLERTRELGPAAFLEEPLEVAGSPAAGSAARHPRPSSLRTDFEPPGSATEKLLVDLWQSLLGIEPVGIRDDFFELGGDSVIGLQIAARARKTGLALSPRDLFDHPTIAALATALDAAAEAGKKVPAERADEPRASADAGRLGLTPGGSPDADVSAEEMDEILASLELPEGFV